MATLQIETCTIDHFHCSALQHTASATHCICNTLHLQHTASATHCYMQKANVLGGTSWLICRKRLQEMSPHGASPLQHTSKRLQHTWNRLQRTAPYATLWGTATATHCNTLQHMSLYGALPPCDTLLTENDLCCSVLHCIVVCCSTLQLLQRVAMPRWQKTVCVAVFYNVLQRVAVPCWQKTTCVAVCCSKF